MSTAEVAFVLAATQLPTTWGQNVTHSRKSTPPQVTETIGNDLISFHGNPIESDLAILVLLPLK
jgi:hypothetical protein